jgi:hypothetical protein
MEVLRTEGEEEGREEDRARRCRATATSDSPGEI